MAETEKKKKKNVSTLEEREERFENKYKNVKAQRVCRDIKEALKGDSTYMEKLDTIVTILKGAKVILSEEETEEEESEDF